MTDIVERLCACTRLGDGWWKIDQHLLMSDAIDEIVRLRVELERTRQAWVSGDDPMCEDVCMETCKGPCGVGEVQP